MNQSLSQILSHTANAGSDEQSDVSDLNLRFRWHKWEERFPAWYASAENQTAMVLSSEEETPVEPSNEKENVHSPDNGMSSGRARKRARRGKERTSKKDLHEAKQTSRQEASVSSASSTARKGKNRPSEVEVSRKLTIESVSGREKRKNKG